MTEEAQGLQELLEVLTDCLIRLEEQITDETLCQRLRVARWALQLQRHTHLDRLVRDLGVWQRQGIREHDMALRLCRSLNV